MTESVSSGETFRYTYDEDGHMIRISDGTNGASVDLAYDAQGRLTQAKSKDTTVAYVYMETGELLSVTEEGIGTTSYTYDETGCNLTSVTDERGGITGYTYDARGNVASITDACGNRTEYTYDACNRKISETDANGGVTTVSYDWYGNISQITDATGNKKQYRYDTGGKLTEILYADGQKETYTYDTAGNVSAITARSGLVTRYEYDLSGNLTKILYPDGTSESYGYDRYGRIIQSVDVYGNQTEYAYDTIGRLISLVLANGEIYQSNYEGNTTYPVSVSNGEKTAVYAYDIHGNMLSSTDVFGNTDSYAYDSHNQITESVDACGNQTSYVYDAAGNCIRIEYPDGTVTEAKYDLCDRRIKVQSGKYSLTYTYDAVGNVTACADACGNKTRYEYDSLNRITAVYNADGVRETAYTYDAVGRLITETDASGIETTYQYNQFDQPETVTQKNAEGQTRVYRYTYDAYGNLTETEAPDETTAKQTYDAYGNITSVTNPMGGTTSYTYDNYGRIISESLYTETQKTYTYNAEGLLAASRNGRGDETEYTYDTVGRLTEEKDAEGEIHYTYDKNGNVLTVTEKNADGQTRTITRTYDSRNRVASMTDCNGKTVKYGYDELGNRISLTYAGGEIVRYTYLANGLMESMTDESGYRTSYTYDALGRVKTIAKPDGSVERYEYDAANRMTRHVVEAAGEVLQDDSYTYDAWGNIVSIVSTNEDKEGTRSSETVVMTYDSMNRMLTYNGEEVCYDADGNMTYGPVDGTMEELTYDSRNRLIRAGETSYEYDAESVRTAVVTEDYREEYTVDRETTFGQVLEVDRTYTDGTTEAERYYYGNGLVYEKKQADSEESAELLVYHFNHLGSTALITDADGAVVRTFNYGTYGELLTDEGEDAGRMLFLYNGEYGVITDENGLYYMRARYYSPEMRRFLNQDILTGSIDNPASLNRYSYVEGNPVSYTDPFGLSPYNTVSTVIHIGLDIAGIFHPAFNLVNAAYYFAEGNVYGGVESVVFGAAGAAGKSLEYMAKGARLCNISEQTLHSVITANRILATGFAANDTGQGIAGMIEKYGIEGADISIQTALEVANVISSGLQTGAYGRGSFNGNGASRKTAEIQETVNTPVVDPMDELDWNAVVNKKGQTRREHVAEHEKDSGKDLHGVFYKDSYETVNEAWKNRRNAIRADDSKGDVYIIQYPNAGYEGGKSGSKKNLDYVMIVTKKGTNQLFTAFPYSIEHLKGK